MASSHYYLSLNRHRIHSKNPIVSYSLLSSTDWSSLDIFQFLRQTNLKWWMQCFFGSRFFWNIFVSFNFLFSGLWINVFFFISFVAISVFHVTFPFTLTIFLPVASFVWIRKKRVWTGITSSMSSCSFFYTFCQVRIHYNINWQCCWFVWWY